MLYRQMPLNIQINWIKIKDSLEQNKSSTLKHKGKDGSGLQFDFATGGQEIKISIILPP